jgi:DNA-binding MarR family transcriptional regulator
MSIALMSAMFNAALPYAQKMVLVVIADRANDEGEGCWYSVATIATKSGMSPRAVQVQIQKLAADGYLRRQERPERRGSGPRPQPPEAEESSVVAVAR